MRRRLKEAELISRRPPKKSLLSKKNLRDRIEFCNKYKDLTAKDWAKVIFSDESPFSCFGNRKGSRVRRQKGENFKLECLLPTVKHPETFHVWGCSLAQVIGPYLILPKGTAMNYDWCLKTLKDHLLPKVNKYFADGRYYFQDDGVPCHRAKVVIMWMEDNGVPELVQWPGNLPILIQPKTFGASSEK